MSIVTIYGCDRCKKEQQNNDQMWEIAISLRHSGSQYHNSANLYHKQLWCRGCVDAFQALGHRVAESERKRQAEADAAPEKAPPTLEDMVRELAREEATDVVANQ